MVHTPPAHIWYLASACIQAGKWQGTRPYLDEKRRILQPQAHVVERHPPSLIKEMRSRPTFPPPT